LLLLGGEATQTNLLIFDFTQPKMEYTIYCNRCEIQYNNEMGFFKGRLPFASTWAHPGFWWVRVAHLFSFCVFFRSEFHVVMLVTISASKRCSVRHYLLFVRGRMFYLHFLFVWL